jgi:NAD(P)-dependent dehydrogenase (short-subunit alcohol dehydrogenase family)
MAKNIVTTGASSGLGALIACRLADAGHIVYAGIRGTAIAKILADTERLDVVVHNAGHMVPGPSEAFTPEQIAKFYDINVLSTQRVNRAALPHRRAQNDGLLVWVESSSTRGGTPPYLGPYFAAKAAEDARAVSYAAQLTRFGIDTAIIVSGSFTKGTNHFAHADHAAEAATYDTRYAGLLDQVAAKLAELAPPDADPNEVARAVVRVVDTPKGQRAFRVHIDPANDDAAEVNALGDRIRATFYQHVGLADLLTPRTA